MGEGSHAHRCFPTLLFSRLCTTNPSEVAWLHVRCELLLAPVSGTACCLLLLALQHTLGALRAEMGNNHQQHCVGPFVFRLLFCKALDQILMDN